jgi:hypothetical protein
VARAPPPVRKGELAQEKVKRPAPPRLKTFYDTELRPKLMKELALKNAMEIPKLTKVTINIGLGEAVSNPKLLDVAVEELAMITGPEAGGDQVAQVHRQLQAAPGPEDRGDGDPAPRAHVRVRRSPDQLRPAARA